MNRYRFEKRYCKVKIIGDIIPDVMRELEKIKAEQKQIQSPVNKDK